MSTRTTDGVDEKSAADASIDAFESDLIEHLNHEFKGRDRIAFNLSTDSAPTNVKRWISTGSRQLDYIISNRRDGGIPEGRITEIFGPPSVGKSHIALNAAKSVQALGGICVYIDTENATSIENLATLGVDVSRRFVFVEESCTEDVFAIIDTTLKKMSALKHDVPVLVVWDSVAASSPRAELDANYDKDSIGLQARAMSKGLRKITSVIANSSATLLCLNQTRMKIGVLYGDPTTTSGGMALSFHASVRVQLGHGAVIRDESNNAIGARVTAKTVKNKVAVPQRRVSFDIMFGRGISEHEQMFDVLRERGEVVIGDLTISVKGDGQWKSLVVADTIAGNVVVEKKFRKAEFGSIVADGVLGKHVLDLVEATYVWRLGESRAKTDVASQE